MYVRPMRARSIVVLEPISTPSPSSTMPSCGIFSIFGMPFSNVVL